MRVDLADLPENSSQHMDKVLKLLELSGTYGDAFYSYNSDNRMLQLYTMIELENLTEKLLNKKIEMVSSQTVDQLDAWLTTRWTTERHVGLWTSESGNSKMTIDLQGDGSFALTNQVDDNVTRITGFYKIEGGELKMRDTDDNVISGEIEFLDGNHFDFNVNDKKLSFERS